MTIHSNHQRIGKQLTLFAGVCFLLIFVLFSLTRGRVLQNRQDFLNASLGRVLPAGVLLSDFSPIVPIQQGGRVVYPACQNGQLHYALTQIETDKGYSGAIRLLVNIDVRQQRIVAVRPLFHKETPGLGDQMDVDKSDWLQQFARPLSDSSSDIALKRDGGKLDAMTGATITSRAVADVIAAQIYGTKAGATDAWCGTN